MGLEKIRKIPRYEICRCRGLTFEGRSKENFGHHASWEDDGALQAAQHDASDRFVDSPRRFQGRQRGVVDRVRAPTARPTTSNRGNRGHSGVRSQSPSRIFIGKVCDRSRGRLARPYTSTGGYFENAGQYHASGVSEHLAGGRAVEHTWG